MKYHLFTAGKAEGCGWHYRGVFETPATAFAALQGADSAELRVIGDNGALQIAAVLDFEQAHAINDYRFYQAGWRWADNHFQEMAAISTEALK